MKELATFVNSNVPHTNWNTKDARKMLNDYLMEFEALVTETPGSPPILLDKEDVLSEFQTVQNNLNARCLHFQRFQQLHKRFAMEEAQDEIHTQRNEQNKEEKQKKTTYGKVQLDMTDTQSSRKDKEVVPKKIGTVTKKKVKANGALIGKEMEKVSEKEIVTGAIVAAKSVINKKNENEEKKSQSKTKQRPKSKKQPSKEKNVVPSSLFIVLTSDEEENETPTILQRLTRSKRQASMSPEQSNDRGYDFSSWNEKKKLRRVESAIDATGKANVMTGTLTQATQTTSLHSDGLPDSLVNDKNMPREHTSSQISGNEHTSLMAKAARPARRLPAISQYKLPVDDAGPHPSVEGWNPASSSQNLTHTNAAPNALRSAIAQAVSQRQQLLFRSQAERCQRTSTSESDDGLCDIDFRKERVSCFGPRSSNDDRYEARPSIGLLPPFIDRSLTTDVTANLERKRVFLRAKELAFDQLKWQRENEFQQQELELLRYEMEAREALARQELKIKRMRIRAAVIQPMISAGASFADIVERLKLL
ncbi:unnamed protein product [Peronospora belbahrii]|uniref:Uncharacterized protein n=1 Tax=Peronospora belbahrii TaxID=622444 RepID=A0ABN8DEI7_9STRA|nr:unnamed protein product [Peronospora belbahrii]